jgi:nitrate reductase gamma subunit
MASSLSPATRRIVGLMMIVAGGLLVIAQVLRFAVSAAEWQQGGWSTVQTTYLLLSVLMLGLGILIIRYGWRMRQDGRISDEPGKGRIS